MTNRESLCIGRYDVRTGESVIVAFTGRVTDECTSVQHAMATSMVIFSLLDMD